MLSLKSMGLRDPLKIAFATRTSEFSAGKAEVQMGRSRCYSSSKTHLSLTTQPDGNAAVRSQNEFLEVPLRTPAFLLVT